MAFQGFSSTQSDLKMPDDYKPGDLVPDQYGDLQDPRAPADIRPMGPMQKLARQSEREADKAKSADEAYRTAVQPSNRAPGAPDISQSLSPLELEALMSLNYGRSKTDEAAANAPLPENAATTSMPAMDITAKAPPGKRSLGPQSADAPTPSMYPEGAMGPTPPPAAQPNLAAPAAPKAPTKSPEELAWEQAQKQVDDKSVRSKISDVLAAFTSNPDAIWKRNADARQKPFLDLANKYDYLQKVRENNAKNAQAQREADMGDANSPLTKRNAAMLYGAYGLKVPQGFTAEQTQDYVAASKLKGEQREKELNRLREEARDRESGRHNRAEEGNQRAQTAATLAEKRLAAQAGKPIPDMMVPKISAQADAPAILKDIEEAQKKVGLSGVLSKLPFVPTFGAEKEYENKINAGAGPLGLAMFPGARSESPELTKMAKDALPSGLTFSDTAKKQIENVRKNTARSLDTTLKTLEAGGTSPREIAATRQAAAANAGGVLQTKVINGKNYSQLPDGRWVEHD